jgi:hypothetical protein
MSIVHHDCLYFTFMLYILTPFRNYSKFPLSSSLNICYHYYLSIGKPPQISDSDDEKNDFCQTFPTSSVLLTSVSFSLVVALSDKELTALDFLCLVCILRPVAFLYLTYFHALSHCSLSYRFSYGN